MMRRLLRPLWFLLALVFLIEAWLWDHVAPIIARLVAMIPLQRLKAWIASRVSALSPPASLLVFAVPVVFLLPLKFVALWLLARHAWFAALAVMLFAKVAGVGVTAFVFDITRPQLLQMGWFRRLYDNVMALRGWASELIAPYRERLRNLMKDLRRRTSSHTMRFIRRLRQKVRHRGRGSDQSHLR